MRAFSVALVVGCVAASPATPTENPKPTPSPGLAADAVVDDTTTGTAVPPKQPPPLAYNCQAPLAAIEEVTRLLTVASTHATESAACVDGPGVRVAVDEILVCPTTGAGGKTMGFAATYRVTEFSEGGRGHCRPKCPDPERRRARIELEFEKKGETYRLRAPNRVPGIPKDATPVTKPHKGNCYGDSAPFAAMPVAI